MSQKLLKVRGSTHGPFRDQGALAQALKDNCRFELGFLKMSLPQREAVDMILHKVSRIVCGDPDHADHWVDIAGYAKLGEQNGKAKATDKRAGAENL